MEAVLKPTRVWLVVLGGVALTLAGLGAFAAYPSGATSASASAISIKWGRPTQAERDATPPKIFGVAEGGGNSAEILVYVDGLEPGKTYEIEVEVKEKDAATGTSVKEELEVEDLVFEPVPELPPPDPR